MDIATMNTTKGSLVRYFDVAHEAVLWKLEGLTEYELRRPMTPTGTNLLGVTKHLSLVEAGYFGMVFGRTNIVDMPGESAELDADMFATADEPSGLIIDQFNDVWAAAKGFIAETDLDHEGYVPWWGPDGNPVTLARIIVHMTTEIYRHLGHMDIVRELVDGAVGMRQGSENMPDVTDQQRADYHRRLEEIAAQSMP